MKIDTSLTENNCLINFFSLSCEITKLFETHSFLKQKKTHTNILIIAYIRRIFHIKIKFCHSNFGEFVDAFMHVKNMLMNQMSLF